MINYTFSSKPVKNFEGRHFHSILENDTKIVGYSEIIREIPPILYLNGNAIIFKEVKLSKGEIFGGILRGGEIAGSKISGGEINGGVLYAGQILNGVFNDGKLLGGIIFGGEFNGADIRGGKFYGGIFNKGVKIYDGDWYHGIYNETPFQIQTPEIFWHINLDPTVLFLGCVSGSLNSIDMNNILLEHQYKSQLYNDDVKNQKFLTEYNKILEIYLNRYTWQQ